MSWIPLLALLIGFEAVADIFSKEYSIRGTWPYWVAGISCYIIANAFWLGAIRAGSGLTKGAMVFYVTSAVLSFVIGVIFYKEVLTRVQMVGIGLGVVALALIFWPE
ncbi:MAG: hypothetical protein AAB538_03125 [Patescibacteria group bacterium]